MIKFPSISQFRNVIRNVQHQASYLGNDANGEPMYNKHVNLPTLLFYGNVKLHGTNASVVQKQATDFLVYQSRERELSSESDNAGFCNAMLNHEVFLDKLMNLIRYSENIENSTEVAIYGEWCGGNIQQGVAINGLDKMFVIFAIGIGNEENRYWIRPSSSEFDKILNPNFLPKPFYNINMFSSYTVEVDFNHPERAQNMFVELTLEVEEQCPAGKYFGITGIGEGLVWHCAEKDMASSDFVFKTKGEKHSASKVKTIAAVDVEKLAAMNSLVDFILTGNRLEQMVEGIEVDTKNIGEFIKKCMNDCVKEESDTITQNGYTTKEFCNAATKKAKLWFINKTKG